jgi:ubiquinone/menaquinone biosynthesis C-methylase UbiE
MVGLEVVGLDESRFMGCVVLGRLGGGVLLVSGYAQFLPFQENTFDQIVSTFPSEFILDENTLSESWRVLAPGGEMIILPIAWIKGRAWRDRLAAWLFRVTGQAPDWQIQYIDPFTKAGFLVRVENSILGSDHLLIIHAKKTRH